MGLGDDWHLDRINVTHLPSGRSWAFVLNNWVGKQEAVMQAQVGMGGGGGEAKGSGGE